MEKNHAQYPYLYKRKIQRFLRTSCRFNGSGFTRRCAKYKQKSSVGCILKAERRRQRLLKSELVRARLEIHGDQVRPRPLPADYRYLTIANELTALFQRYAGRSRGALAAALRDYEGDSLDYPVIRGLAAVIEARCTFASPELTLTTEESSAPVSPAELRADLFGRGPVTHKPDMFSQTTRQQALAEAAARLGLSVKQVETALFADLPEEQILLDAGEPIAPGDLIARYNLEVARGILYWAREVRLVVHDNYKDIFKYVKLFKLMYGITPLQPPPYQGGGRREAPYEGRGRRGISSHPYEGEGGRETPSPPYEGGGRRGASSHPYEGGGSKPEGYHITLYGPISPFVKSTIRYGVQFAKFLPALLLCQRWQMEADVQPPGVPSREPLRYRLDDRTDLRTHFKASGPFDSELEADFAAEFEAKYGGAKRKWELAREDELIVVGDTVMIPDFSFTHRKDGRRALLEIVGFWHPEYLRRKLQKVRQAGRGDLILLVYQSANVAEGEFEAASAGEVLTFTRKPILKEVLAAVERCALPPTSGPPSGEDRYLLNILG
jgi:predicted nuclease of restriction endonuclease-like RecB superfamily